MRRISVFWPSIGYAAVIVISIVLSIGGIMRAAHHDPLDGGRGGALAVAISFVILFLRPDYGALLYKLRTEFIPAAQAEANLFLARRKRVPAAPSQSTPELQRSVGALRDQLESNQGAQTTQNYILAGTSVLGTIVWGFGDVVAGWIKFHGQCWLFYCWLQQHGPGWLF